VKVRFLPGALLFASRFSVAILLWGALEGAVLALTDDLANDLVGGEAHFLSGLANSGGMLRRLLLGHNPSYSILSCFTSEYREEPMVGKPSPKR
jgi:hypothetical protein